MEPRIAAVRAQAFTVPTDAPEADGTAAWSETTIVVVHAGGGGQEGMGYSYADRSAAGLVTHTLGSVVEGRCALDPQDAWRAMQNKVRNPGREGIAACAISAVDVALWDLKAKLLGVSLSSLLGRYRESVPIYGSGGFTSYDDRQLAEQLGSWVEREGCRRVKMKIGSDPEHDPARVAAAKAAIGNAVLFVDANGAFGVKQALHLAEVFAAEQGVAWFEEPVSSDDLEGLRRMRDRAPAGMEIAAGEYGYEPGYFRRMLEAGAVDVLQADATRCGGVTGFLQAAALADAHHVDLSAHCAPALHRHLGTAAPRFRHCEWFHDHVRIERMLFDGAPVARDGAIAPDLDRRGLGLDLKTQDAARFAVGAGDRR